MPRLTISMLCLNRVELTRKCVESILAHTTDFELRILDNGSTDETPAYLKALVRTHPNVFAIREEQNIGFIKGHNALVQAATGDYVCILNNDVEVGPQWAEKLIEPLDRDPQIGATGPTDHYGRLTNDFVGTMGHVYSPIEYVSGHALMVPRRVIALHGLFDESVLTWATCEDADFSLRIRQAGYRIVIVSGVPVTHLKRATMDFVDHELLGYDPAENELRNRTAMQQRWGGYLKTRTFSKRKIVVRRSSAIGDVLCVEPILRGLKQKYPNSELTFVSVNPYAEAVKQCPAIDKFETGRFDTAKTPGDLVIDLDDGYERAPTLSMVAAYAQLAGVPGDRPRWYLDQEGHRFAAQLPGDRPICVIATEAGWLMRTWAKARFKEIARRLASRYLVINVGRQESAYTGIGWNLCGKTSLQALAGVYSRADLVVTGDSLHVHLAACFETPTVGIWGGTDPVTRIHGPEHVPVQRMGFPCRGCHHARSAPRHESSCDCGAFRGMKVEPLGCIDIPVDDVWAAVERLRRTRGLR